MEEGNIWQRFKRFCGECVRVVKITKKPDRSEFMTVVKVAGLGILIIGLLGFAITMVKEIAFT
jgi:protein transport protein SEC61 subunit gamma-like protein